MSKKYNLSFPISDALERYIQSEVKRTGVSRADVARMALMLMQSFSKSKKKEKAHATR